MMLHFIFNVMAVVLVNICVPAAIAVPIYAASLAGLVVTCAVAVRRREDGAARQALE